MSYERDDDFNFPIAVGVLLALSATIMLIIVAVVLSTTRAKAHEWYDNDCCSGRDCTTVDDKDVVELSDRVVVRMPDGATVTVSYGPNVRVTKDPENLPAVCAVKQQSWMLRCVYLKRRGV